MGLEIGSLLISAFATLLTMIKEKYQFTQNAADHESYSQKFKHIQQKVSEYICLPTDSRQNDLLFFKEIITEYRLALDKPPEIRDSTSSEYESLVGSTIHTPNLLTTINDIKIAQNPSSNTTKPNLLHKHKMSHLLFELEKNN